MRSWLPILVLVLIAACNKKQPVPATTAPVVAPRPVASRDASIKDFWQWFAKHAAALHAEKDVRAVMEKVSAELEKIDPGIFAEISATGDVRSLIVSADGKSELFPLVQAVCAAQPTIPGWKVLPLRQRRPLEALQAMRLEVGDKSYAPTEITFVAEKSGDKLDITLFSPGDELDDGIKSMMLIMLDHTIGEYDTEMKIGAIGFAPKREAPKSAKPLHTLARLVDETFPPGK